LLAILLVEGVLHSVSLTLAYPARRIGGLNWTGLWPMLTSGGLMRSRLGNLAVLLVASLTCCVHSTLSARLVSSLWVCPSRWIPGRRRGPWGCPWWAEGARAFH